MSIAFEKLRWGSHFCYFYENKVNFLKVLTTFFMEGLENNEYCIWILPENTTKQEIIVFFLKKYGKFEEYLEIEQIKFFNYQDWYNISSTLKDKEIINSWIQTLDYALKKGYNGIRITEDVRLNSKEELDAFLGYELQFNTTIKEEFIKAICTYPIFKYQKSQILDIAGTHQFVLIDINDTQKIIQNSEIKNNLKAKEILKKNLENLQRIESIGLLSSGIIHDFKHSLTIIKNNIDLALMKIDQGEDVSRFLNSVKSTVNVTAQTIEELFSYGQLTGVKDDFSINQIITELVNLLDYLIKDQILIEMDLSQNLGNVRGDSGKIKRILINLINNARDAMPTGGKLTILTKNLSLNKSKIYEHFTLDSGNYVVLSVKDSGIGMDKSILSHIFEIFYTTKNSKKGTGLGLPMVISYLNDFRGKIEVLSKPNEGSIFNLYIPVEQI
jgi:signal transduction histidine kinase